MCCLLGLTDKVSNISYYFSLFWKSLDKRKSSKTVLSVLQTITDQIHCDSTQRSSSIHVIISSINSKPNMDVLYHAMKIIESLMFPFYFVSRKLNAEFSDYC